MRARGRAADTMALYLRTGVFAAFLASAGLPLYIHLPQFAAGAGISLSTLGLILIGIRIMDVAQDPVLGRLAQRFDRHRAALAGVSVAALAAGFLWLFTIQPGVLGMTAALVVLFTAYSAATILFYARGVTLAGRDGQMRLAGWREAGALAGVILAASLPTVLSHEGNPQTGYAVFGIVLAGLALVVWITTRKLWHGTASDTVPKLPLGSLIRSGAGGLLVLAFVNALPVALTSTLFLFFVEDKLRLGPMAGAFLILFFAAAGLAAPVWSRAAQKLGPRPVLLGAMLLAIASFVGAALLPAGAQLGFGAICLASGVALGADMVILPALFAGHLARAQTPPAAAFGLWSFMAKLALAIAAAIALPLLDVAGYTPGGPNPETALSALTFAYAVLPCILKLLAIALLARLPHETVTP